MAHRKLTTLCTVGFAISVGLWAVSQVGLTYVPSTRTLRFQLHSGAVELSGLQPPRSTDEFCGDLGNLKADPDIADRAGQIDIDTCTTRHFDSSRPQSFRAKYGNWSSRQAFSHLGTRFGDRACTTYRTLGIVTLTGLGDCDRMLRKG